ncbi:hypothetical protein M5D96_000102, partial [Drosophila gunungcola]
TLTCIICRIPIKPSVWKVHINSKQHKSNVDQAKQNKQLEKPVVTTITTKESPAKSSPVTKSTTHQDKTPQTNLEQNPPIFFDEDKTSKSEAARLQDEEWQRFQQEIKKAATESSVIVADEQEDINLKRHIKEIDEQIDNWKRFIKINDQKTLLLNKKRRICNCGRIGTVVGWGRTSEGGELPSIVNQVKVPIMSITECRNQKYKSTRITSSMLCAGRPSMDSCQGDSGGPLLLSNGVKYFIVGIVSWGVGCGRDGYPGVYSRVSKFIPWIKSNLENTCLCS